MNIFSPALIVAAVLAIVSAAVPKAWADMTDAEAAAAQAAGFSAQRLERLHIGMSRLVAEQRRAGFVYAVAKGDSLVTLRPVGWQDREAQIPMARDTLFRVFSLTKPVTAVGALILMERGLIGLHDPVARYLPGFADATVIVSVEGSDVRTQPARQQLRIHHLLTHTAGVGYAFDYPPALGVDRERIMSLDISIAEGLEYLAGKPLLFEPGTQWEYGLGIDILGRVIELVSGQRLDEFLEAEIFAPLAMHDTGFIIPEPSRQRLAKAYRRSDQGELVEATGALPRSGDYLNPDASMFSGGGGLVSSVPNMLRFAQMLINRGELDGTRLLAPATVAAMTSRQLPEHLAPIRENYPPGSDMWRIFSGYTYGWGLNVLDRPEQAMRVAFKGAFMKDGLADIYFVGVPDRNLVLLVFSQHLIGLTDDIEESVLETFESLVYQALND